MGGENMGVYPLGTYVYLKSLRTKNPEFAIEAANYSTFKNTKTNDAGEEINIISTAISTLSSIAAGQAQIEHQAIQNYIRKIDQYIAEHGEDDIPTILLNSLKK